MPKALPLSGLARWPLVLPGRDHGLRRIIDDACEPLGIELDVVAEIEALGSVKKAVEAGIGRRCARPWPESLARPGKSAFEYVRDLSSA